MRGIPISKAKANLSRLVAHAEAGEEIVVTRRGRPVAKIVRYVEPRPPRQPGDLKGQIELAEDFDATPSDFDAYT